MTSSTLNPTVLEQGFQKLVTADSCDFSRLRLGDNANLILFDSSS
jgi:hypothetical protein